MEERERMSFQFAQADADFKIFDHINQVLVNQERREEWVSREPRVWPSAASAELFDQSVHKIIGKCHRALYFGWTAAEVTNQVDAQASWKFVTGRLLENALTELAAKSLEDTSIHVASGVRIFVPDVLLSFELDLVVRNPKNNRAVLVENKTFSSKNYSAAKDILKDGRPKAENLMQTILYLFEIRTGARLRQLILEGVADRQAKDRKKAELEKRGIDYSHRNRIEVSYENLELIDDGPITAKLTYLDRSDGGCAEYDVTIEEDLDGLHYPVVSFNGGEPQTYKNWAIESIYARFKKLQAFYYEARQKAEIMLAEQGILPPEEPDEIFGLPEDKAKYREQTTEYWKTLGEAMRNLPKEFLPAAEYEFTYEPDKIEEMWSRGLIAKTRYEGWKKHHKGKERIGDWQCAYCDFRLHCQKIENPQMAYLIQDINAAVDEEVGA
jgi:hypothetical protein